MKRIDLTWIDVICRAETIAINLSDFFEKQKLRTLKLYGVPRGGVFACLLVFTALSRMKEYINILHIVEKVGDADVYIDDIVDTGKTKHQYGEDCDGEIPFFALVDKTTEDIRWKNTWVSFPWERMTNDDGPVTNIVRLLEYIGEDPNREGLKETPDRVLKSYEKLYGGYKMEPEKIIKVFKDDSCDEMVLVKNMEFYSTCEHHMLPFYGKAHIAYIPNGQVIGVSKLGRILEMFSRRLQIQERLCQQVTELIDKSVKPLGSACILEAQHLCMTARGIEKQHSTMVTSSLTGVFKEKAETRNELLKMITK